MYIRSMTLTQFMAGKEKVAYLLTCKHDYLASMRWNERIRKQERKACRVERV